MATQKITQEEIEAFIDGRDPQERIVNLIYPSYDSNYITVVYRNEKDQKCTKNEDFYPFLWATRAACERLCGGDREKIKSLLGRYGIGVKKLSQEDVNGEVRHEFDNGYLFMFFAKVPMSYGTFLQFFKDADNPVYSKNKDDKTRSKAESRQYLCVTPQEQFMISTGKRFFKGYDDYDKLLRMTFDLETTGLDTEHDKIIQIGIRMNRPFPGYPNGFQKIINIEGDTEEERAKCELWAIEQMLKMIYTFKPDIITAHNGENFDWNMIIGACERLGTTLEALSSKYFKGDFIRKENRDTVLKLGGEIEYYKATVVPGIIVTDSLHAVRRAQALDSNMLKADLKYVTEYSEMKKPNRVYVPGGTISKVEGDLEEHYAFNDENGDWYRYDPTAPDTQDDNIEIGKKNYIPVRNKILDGYELKSGQYIVERYLFDDLWECDKVEHRYNTPNFLVCKMIPVPYKKCTTMGTAGQWKSLMMAWSYEKGLAIPMFGESKRFTGGLSRLLRVGFVKNVVKLDFNSLYPSIILTWGITDPIDLMKSMLYFLEHVLTQREKYKGLKKKAGKKAEAAKKKLQNHEYNTKEEGKALNDEMQFQKQEESANDKKQLPLKIFGNSFFGSYGAPDVFPWGSLKCAEQVTCTGRQCLRLMISHFHNIGYEPIVGDSFTPDTPVLIKYDKSQYIDIVPIETLITESAIKIDEFGREYDYSEKPYSVLCRSGWIKPSYIYRHKTDKDIYEVIDGETRVEVTEDHSLFNAEQKKIKPSEINENTKLEYFDKEDKLAPNVILAPLNEKSISHMAKMVADGTLHMIPAHFLNSPEDGRHFYEAFMAQYRDDIEYSKTVLAGLFFIKKFFIKK